MLPQLGHFSCTYCTFAKFPMCLLSNVLRDRNRYLYWLPWTPSPTAHISVSFSDVRGSVAYIFYTLWQYLEFIEEQLGPVRNVVTLDCLPRPGYRLQTSHNTKLPDGETNKMYIHHWLQAAGLHIHLSSLMAAKMSILSSG